MLRQNAVPVIDAIVELLLSLACDDILISICMDIKIDVWYFESPPDVSRPVAFLATVHHVSSSYNESSNFVSANVGDKDSYFFINSQE